MLRIRSIVQDQPMSPADRAVWWVEYVIRHGGAKHLRAAGANISWRQYLELDLVFIIISVIISVSAIFMLIIYLLWKYVVNNFIPNIKIKTS